MLIELYELTPNEPIRRFDYEASLADRVMHEGLVMRTAVLAFLNRLVNGQDGDGPPSASPN